MAILGWWPTGNSSEKLQLAAEQNRTRIARTEPAARQLKSRLVLLQFSREKLMEFGDSSASSFCSPFPAAGGSARVGERSRQVWAIGECASAPGRVSARTRRNCYVGGRLSRLCAWVHVGWTLGIGAFSPAQLIRVPHIASICWIIIKSIISFLMINFLALCNLAAPLKYNSQWVYILKTQKLSTRRYCESILWDASKYYFLL